MFQKNFKIKKGRHYSRHGILPQFPTREFEFEFMLSDECWYGRNELDDTTGVNKIMGRSMGLNPKRNSARIGWQPVFNKKGEHRLYLYLHEYWEKYQYEIARVKSGVKYNVLMLFYNDALIVQLDGVAVGAFDFAEKPMFGWKLFPYFGGNSHAPWDMKIYARKL